MSGCVRGCACMYVSVSVYWYVTGREADTEKERAKRMCGVTERTGENVAA